MPAMRSSDPTPSGLSVGRPGGPTGPTLSSTELAQRRILDGLIDRADGDDRVDIRK
jgi:hypothetical protein